MVFKVSMDSSGRVVLPKLLRQYLGIQDTADFDVSLDGTAIRFDVKKDLRRQVKEVDGWPVLSAVEGMKTTDVDVQRVRDGQR